MNCKQVRETMPEVAAGLGPLPAETEQHLAGCSACAAELAQLRRTMAALDEWRVPEPSPYFDVRLRARLREEAARTSLGWLGWIRKPALAVALTLLLGAGISLFYNSPSAKEGIMPPQPGTAVSDLQTLDRDHDLFADFDVLDELAVQPDVNP